MKTFLVGGAVRDELLGRPVNDRDWVVVGATPQEMLDDGFQQVGSDFPVFLNNDGEEFALARQERKVGTGYHGFETTYDPSVTLEDDLVRRDLTINAMARDPDTDELIDPHNGQADLESGILRHVSEAFSEDPVRVLRVARFAARFNFEVAPETMELMKKLVEDGEVDSLTTERVWAEMEKAIMEEHPMKFFWTLERCGALEVLFPEIGRTIIDSGFSVNRASLHNKGRLTRFALLFVRANDPQTLLHRFKAPSDVKRIVRKFCILHTLLSQTVNRPGSFGVWEVEPKKILELLQNLDAFRNSKEVFMLADAIDHMADHDLMPRMDAILAAFRESRKVSFASLTAEQQKTLKGKDVGKAIAEKRIEVIQEASD